MKRCLFLLMLTSSCAVGAVELPGIPQFIDDMVERHHFRRDELEQVFAQAEYRPSVIEAISRPSVAKPWPEYRTAFVNRQRIKLGLAFWRKYGETLRRAEKRYGVPQEVIVALIGVETLYGRNAGRYRVLDALTTLAFDYPRRTDFFRGELEQFLLLAREHEFDLLSTYGSYAGAMGVPQFMPSSYRKYGVDFDGDRVIDLQHQERDAIGSVANYLKSFGWAGGETLAAPAEVVDAVSLEEGAAHTVADWAVLGVRSVAPPGRQGRLIAFTVGDHKEYWLAFNNFDVITRYNNSDYYAMTVLQLAEALKAAKANGRS